MSVHFTPEQESVIKARDCDILVSAAAGSGKTAVLSERIISLVTDKEKPIDIDHILVVTFTRAAAAEMSERVGKNLSALIDLYMEKDPEAPILSRLREQYDLLQNASICTIDSFAKRVITEHYEEADIDPSFRIADINELKILERKILADILEEKYSEGSEEFIKFTEYYSSGKSDSNIEKIIIGLYEFSTAFSDSDKWLVTKKEEYLSGESFKKCVNELISLLHKYAEGAVSIADNAVTVCDSPDGPAAYRDVLLSDIEMINKFIGANNFSEVKALLDNFAYDKLPAIRKKKDEDVSEITEQKKKLVKDLREEYKKGLDDILTLFGSDIEAQRSDFDLTKPYVAVAFDLALLLSERFKEAKQKKNILDFSDIEHLALKVLRDEAGNPTDAARDYADFYAEVMTDEYQDSNLLQEEILTAITDAKEGMPYYFCVGDVKQSIYSFRQARPDLFMEKYRTFTEEGRKRKIILSKNFRSRKEVTDSVNSVFTDIMHESLGSIEYDRDACLYPYKVFPDTDGDYKTEIIISSNDDLPEDTDEEKVNIANRLSGIDLEAYSIAEEIKKLHAAGKKYSDIAILLRKMSGIGEKIKKDLLSFGIPAVSETTSGYFEAWEDLLVLDMLKTIDNPRDDIPLTAVLLSPVGKFTVDELAELRTKGNSEDLIVDLLYNSDTKKAKDFVNDLDRWRKLSCLLSVHELLRRLVYETNFIDYVSAMPGGKIREANVKRFIEMASQYESTGDYTVSGFVNYIDSLIEAEVDFGEADVNDALDAVKIMTIHKSKGLQFPVVFIAGLGNKINKRELQEQFIINDELGIGSKCFNLTTREKWDPLTKTLISKKMNESAIAEEMRVIYVAMTRAEEKLYISAAMDKTDNLAGLAVKNSNFLSLLKAVNDLDIILPSVLRDSEHFKVSIKNKIDIINSVIRNMSENEASADDLSFLSGNLPLTSDEEKEYEKLIADINYIYPYEDAVNEKIKYTVSELKKLHLSEAEAGEKAAPEDTTLDEGNHYIPDFARTVNDVVGANRGTLYHSVLRHIDFTIDHTEPELEHEFGGLKEAGKLTDEEYNALNASDFMKLFDSDLAKRMANAAKENRLFRETPFVYKSDRVKSGTVLIQGVCDAWFIEKNKIILIDYKTDKVYKDNVLRDRYANQIDYYAEALSKAVHLPVAEKYLYSFTMGKAIKCD